MRNVLVLCILFSLISLLSPLLSCAAAGGSVAPVVLVADAGNLGGITAWWANMYNESHLWLTVPAVLVVSAIGVIFGMLADTVMDRIGIDLKSGSRPNDERFHCGR